MPLIAGTGTRLIGLVVAAGKWQQRQQRIIKRSTLVAPLLWYLKQRKKILETESDFFLFCARREYIGLVIVECSGYFITACISPSRYEIVFCFCCIYSSHDRQLRKIDVGDVCFRNKLTEEKMLR